MRDILKGADPQIAALVETIALAQADVLVLTGIDYDRGGAALTALAEQIDAAGLTYPYRFAARPNTGRPTGFDLDGDGRSYRARDAHSWGLYSGQGGLALLSRYPLATAEARSFTDLLWRDLPQAQMPMTAPDQPYFPAEVWNILRLSNTAHWDVPVVLPGGARVSILAFAASPPVFDGPEDRNGRRNADETHLWRHYLDGRLDARPPDRFVILGTGNVDPVDGEGDHTAIRALLSDPRIQDPQQRGPGGATTANASHIGDAGLDTVDWWETDNGPGNLRVDYALPSATLTVAGGGVMWSDPAIDPDAAARQARASRHRLVWVDIALP